MSDLREKIRARLESEFAGTLSVDSLADDIIALLTDWRPIETAPKDGTPILVWGKWDGEIGDWSKHPPSAGVAARWYDSWQSEHSDAYGCWCNATHWRPLPEPPQETRDE